MNIKIIAVGKLKERFWVEAAMEYLKRLKAYATVEVIEVADVNPAHVSGDAQAREREAEGILKALSEKDHVVLLAIKARELSSEDLADHLEDLALQGHSDVAFVIGGSTGVSDRVKAKAHEAVSFGPITLPHNLARIVLLEQLYRSFKIIRGEPYHK